MRVLLLTDNVITSKGIHHLLLSKFEYIQLEKAHWDRIGELHLQSYDLILFQQTERFPLFKGKLVQVLQPDHSLPLLLLMDSHELNQVATLMELGVRGILTTKTSETEFYLAVESVLNNQFYFAKEVMTCLSQQMTEQVDTARFGDLLTKREQEILGFIVGGKSSKTIALELDLSPHTVQTHRKHILKKLGVSSAAALTKLVLSH